VTRCTRYGERMSAPEEYVTWINEHVGFNPRGQAGPLRDARIPQLIGPGGTQNGLAEHESGPEPDLASPSD